MSIVVGDVSIYDYPEQFNFGYLTGAQPVWSDNDDATSSTGFATSETLFAVATIMYAPLSVGHANADLTVNVRASWGLANTGFGALQANVELYDTEPGPLVDPIAGDFITGSTLGDIEDLSLVFSTANTNPGHTWPEVQAALETGNLWVAILPSFPFVAGFNNGLTVYEVGVVGAAVTTVPARRLYPRTDHVGPGLGRVFPPPNTPQSGARFGSASPL